MFCLYDCLGTLDLLINKAQRWQSEYGSTTGTVNPDQLRLFLSIWQQKLLVFGVQQINM